jgi:hypothetical protein
MEPNSPYTRALLPILKTPGLSMAEIASRVRREVVRLASTAQPPHVQTPAYYDELVGQFLLKAGPAEAKAADGRDDELAGLKAKLDKLQEALTAKQAAPKDSSASEQVTKLMEQISGLEAQVKRLEAARPAAPKGAAPTAGKTAAPSAGRPDPRAHSVSVWPKNSLQLGQTVSTNTPYGKLTCTSRGPGARACRWD